MWVKLDDHFPDHPKVIAAGPLAAWLYVAGLCYANRLLTDGFVPAAMVPRLVLSAGTKHDARPEELAARLCEVGLWTAEHPAGGSWGYRIHDYTVYQRSKQRVITDRQQNAQRVTDWRKKAAPS
jgi:hypothetical protein